jgi:hypothetical protein
LTRTGAVIIEVGRQGEVNALHNEVNASGTSKAIAVDMTINEDSILFSVFRIGSVHE